MRKPVLIRKDYTMKLSARGICQSYCLVPVINNINLEVAEGEIVALLGPSGVGKTTLFNVLSGISRPDQGQVFVDDQDITGQAGRISYMLQKDLLFEYKKVIDNVALPLLIKGIKKADAYEQAQHYFKLFGLEGTEFLYPQQLSGGMRQRAALLRTFLFSKDIVLLDEPFSSLDALTKRTLHHWYANIARQFNIATLLITHDIDEAIRLSQRIYLMTGKPGEITGHWIIEGKDDLGDKFETSRQGIRYKTEILDKLGL